ncbi:hypothetical protein OAZ14_03025, partial [Candidatus Pelagibacter sp.]|nr:hypothetical protein [Candidatus Pelagibacter sp.]
FFSIFIVFNFSKNVLRLINEDNIFFGVHKIHNKYVNDNEYTNIHVKIFRPDVKNNSLNGWQGRLCWNIPFICSYNKLDIRKKNGYLIINKLID